jgi:hypothetical protein
LGKRLAPLLFISTHSTRTGGSRIHRARQRRRNGPLACRDPRCYPSPRARARPPGATHRPLAPRHNLSALGTGLPRRRIATRSTPESCDNHTAPRARDRPAVGLGWRRRGKRRIVERCVGSGRCGRTAASSRGTIRLKRSPLRGLQPSRSGSGMRGLRLLRRSRSPCRAHGRSVRRRGKLLLLQPPTGLQPQVAVAAYQTRLGCSRCFILTHRRTIPNVSLSPHRVYGGQAPAWFVIGAAHHAVGQETRTKVRFMECNATVM